MKKIILSTLLVTNVMFFATKAFSKDRTVMVHLFEWKWTDIAKECENYLGPNGFAAVQVSPPNEHAIVDGFPWYQRYQPVSYKIESRSGNRSEFIDMVNRCKKSGVDIYVDAVINHMTGVVPVGENKVGIAGSPFSNYKYPIYSYPDFHHCGRNGDDTIKNYSDIYEVQNCELVGLADLNTESDYVVKKIQEYLLDLVNIGVAGFRIDAAKHMNSDSLHKILSALPASTYIYQEVIDQGGEAIKASDYFQNGDVTEFKYSLDLSRVMQSGKLAWLNSAAQFGEGWNYMPSTKAVVFVDNHDNQRGHGGGGHILNYKDTKNYELAAILMLAWPYGYPQIMSSFAFQDPSQGPPSNSAGQTEDVNCMDQANASSAGKGWVCEHRWQALREMVKFRNHTNSNFYISNWFSNGENQIAFSRGNSGFVVINHEDFQMDQTLQTGLAAGKYCNILSKDSANGICTEQFEVDSSGLAHFVLKPQSAVAIY